MPVPAVDIDVPPDPSETRLRFESDEGVGPHAGFGPERLFSVSGLHHVEVWVAEYAEARAQWGWLLSELGFERSAEWPEGESWAAGGAYVTFTTSPNLSATAHDRRSPGVNHLAFTAGTPDRVDAIMARADQHGWRPLYHDRYPHAGGPDHYAGWLENSAGFKAEVVADES